MTTMEEILRSATPDDLRIVRDWLVHEEQDGEGFIHNWSLIEEAATEGHMLVAADVAGPVAFLTHGLSRNSILQVRSDRKRSGIGRRLVEHAIQLEEAANNAVLIVQCEPKTSIPFWTRMGFAEHRERPGSGRPKVYMHRLSTIAHQAAQGDDLERISIKVYPDSCHYASGPPVAPDRVISVGARALDRRTLQLARRIAIAREGALGDVVIEVVARGRRWFHDKAKRNEAAAIGFQQTPYGYGWYADTLILPDAPLPD